MIENPKTLLSQVQLQQGGRRGEPRPRAISGTAQPQQLQAMDFHSTPLSMSSLRGPGNLRRAPLPRLVWALDPGIPAQAFLRAGFRGLGLPNGNARGLPAGRIASLALHGPPELGTSLKIGCRFAKSCGAAFVLHQSAHHATPQTRTHLPLPSLRADLVSTRISTSPRAHEHTHTSTHN